MVHPPRTILDHELRPLVSDDIYGPDGVNVNQSAGLSECYFFTI
jgi:hypothetical protein